MREKEIKWKSFHKIRLFFIYNKSKYKNRENKDPKKTQKEVIEAVSIQIETLPLRHSNPSPRIPYRLEIDESSLQDRLGDTGSL